jgi:release factor glutamine methyltransferase
LKLKEIKSKFNDDLHGIYPGLEIDSFFKLLSEAYLNLSPVEIVLQSDMEIEPAIQEKFSAALKRLKAYEPIQYIIGRTEFFGLPLNVNPDTLIPRPETEELVKLTLQEVAEANTAEKLRILDIGTGAGCIAVALAKNLPDAEISAMDVSEEALKVAEENAKINKVDVHYFQGDILTMESLPEKYHFIVSNPPYVRLSEKRMMDSNVVDFEPELAIFVTDEDPLLFYRKIAQLAKRQLTENGKLFFEINEYLGEDLLALIIDEGLENIHLIKDIYGKNRMLKCSYNS